MILIDTGLSVVGIMHYTKIFGCVSALELELQLRILKTSSLSFYKNSPVGFMFDEGVNGAELSELLNKNLELAF